MPFSTLAHSSLNKSVSKSPSAFRVLIVIPANAGIQSISNADWMPDQFR